MDQIAFQNAGAEAFSNPPTGAVVDQLGNELGQAKILPLEVEIKFKMSSMKINHM